MRLSSKLQKDWRNLCKSRSHIYMDLWHFNINHRKILIKASKAESFCLLFILWFFIHLKIKFKANVLELLFAIQELFPGSLGNLTFPKSGHEIGTAISLICSYNSFHRYQTEKHNGKTQSAFLGIPRKQPAQDFSL